VSHRQSPACTDAEVAELYDVLNPWGASDDFYLDLVMRTGAVLDVGCGTGSILKRARDAGHPGRLVGVDPAPAMLAVARRRPDIAWHQATAAEMPWDAAFDLAIMTGHAFQSLISDADVRDALAAIRRGLVPGGIFAFETRNPAMREWEAWHHGTPMEVTDPAGRELRISYEVLDVTGDVVTLTETTSDRDGEPLRVDRGRLRFLDPDTLATCLDDAGFAVEARFGGWERQPFSGASHELIVIARVL
jgi:ubiquinone/menaquinone biosynthesis C-methylase UbiE